MIRVQSPRFGLVNNCKLCTLFPHFLSRKFIVHAEFVNSGEVMVPFRKYREKVHFGLATFIHRIIIGPSETENENFVRVISLCKRTSHITAVHLLCNKNNTLTRFVANFNSWINVPDVSKMRVTTSNREGKDICYKKDNNTTFESENVKTRQTDKDDQGSSRDSFK